jgi:hypothetical protein
MLEMLTRLLLRACTTEMAEPVATLNNLLNPQQQHHWWHHVDDNATISSTTTR